MIIRDNDECSQSWQNIAESLIKYLVKKIFLKLIFNISHFIVKYCNFNCMLRQTAKDLTTNDFWTINKKKETKEEIFFLEIDQKKELQQQHIE